MKISEKIDELIIYKCNGIISEAENEELNNWLKSDKSNTEAYKKNFSFYYKCKLSEVKNLPTAISEWHKLKPKLHKEKSVRRLIHRIAQYAAIIAIIIGVVYITNRQEEKTQIAEISNLVKPSGKIQAFLQLSTGEQIQISKESQQALSQVINIEQDSTGAIKYNQYKQAIQTKTEYNTIIVPKSSEYKFTLSDGTKVWLNSDSELRFPVNFSSSSRDVYLKGEAYFEVTSNKHKPFDVIFGTTKVEVFGTSFNVSAYKEDKMIEVALLEGKVQFVTEQEVVTLKPGFMVKMNNHTKEIKISHVDVNAISAWKNGTFIFEDMLLTEIMKKLERWYNVKINIENEELRNIRFTGAATKYRDIEYILRIISKTKTFKYKIEGEKINIYKNK